MKRYAWLLVAIGVLCAGFLVVQLIIVQFSGVSEPEKQEIGRRVEMYSAEKFPDDMIKSVHGHTHFGKCGTATIVYVPASVLSERSFVVYHDNGHWQVAHNPQWATIDGDEIRSEKQCLALVHR